MRENHRPKRKWLNVVVVWFLVVFSHYSLFHLSSEEQYNQYQTYIQELDPRDPEASIEWKESSYERFVNGVLLWAFSMPLITFADKSDFAVQIPFSYVVWNSLIAGTVAYLVLRRLLSRHFPGRSITRLISGESLWEKNAVPESFDKVPVIKIARWLERIEQWRYGPVLIIAFFYQMIGTVLFTGETVEMIGGGGGMFRDLAPFFRLPLTPLLVDSEFWRANLVYPEIKLIVQVANSLIAATFLVVAWNYFKRVK